MVSGNCKRWGVGTLGNTFSGSVTQDPGVGPSLCYPGWTHSPYLLVSTWVVSWKLLAVVAVMKFHRRCVVLALLWKLLSHTRVLNSVFVGLVTLSFAFLQMRVECVHKLCVYIKLTFCLHHAWHSCSVFTALWCGYVGKVTFCLHQTPSWFC